MKKLFLFLFFLTIAFFVFLSWQRKSQKNTILGDFFEPDFKSDVTSWKTFVGETKYTSDGSSKFSISYPNELSGEENVLRLGSTILTIGEKGKKLTGGYSSVENILSPFGEFKLITNRDKNIVVATLPKGEISYIFEFSNIKKGKATEYKEILKKMIQTFRTIKKEEKNNFTSENLKFSFSYSTENPSLEVEEKGNKIFVKSGSGIQSVEFFEKDKNQSLQKAIKLNFLKNISEEECFVVETTQNYKSSKLPSTFKIAEISFPKNETSDEPWWATSNNCPADYSQTNGIRYFLEDENHPDRFVFFNIGQYAIPSEDHSKNWQDTIEFL